MRHVVSATAKAALGPGVIQVEGKRRMGADRWVQALGRLPRAVTHPGHAFAIDASWVQRDPPAIHGEREAVAGEAAGFDLEPFERAIHVAHGAATDRFFAQDVPGLQRGAEFDYDVPLREVADARETELEVRSEPLELERIPGVAQITDYVLEIRLAEVREHPAIMDVGAPANEAVPVWLAPEFADESAQEEMLRQAHARVWWHLESSHFDEAQPAAAALRREKFINAELGTMRVAAGVREQVAKETVRQPGRHVAAKVRTRIAGTPVCLVTPAAADQSIEFLERDFEFVERIVPG